MRANFSLLPRFVSLETLTRLNSSRQFSVSAPAFKKKAKKTAPKKPTEEKKLLLGRPGNNLKVCVLLHCEIYRQYIWNIRKQQKVNELNELTTVFI